jgi:squalene-associated FAD-dependent desaturase
VADPLAADVVVIGAGCAGLSAAVKLAGEGLKVIVAERAPRPGGRASTFVDRVTGERVDNGQHVLFGCYRATYEFLREIGSAHLAPLDSSLSVATSDASGRAFVLRCPPLPPPWHLVAGALRWGAVPLRDRLSVLRFTRLLFDVRRRGAEAAARDVDPSITVAEWLHQQGQSSEMCRWLWAPLVFAALNQSPEDAAAASFVRVLGEMFGPRAADSAVGLPRTPLEDLIAKPAIAFIEARGGRVLLRSPARVAIDDGRIREVRVGTELVKADVVISAVPWHALESVLQDVDLKNGLGDVLEHAQNMRSMPIVTANLWFDRPVFDRATMPAGFLGYVGGTVQWFFDRRAILGESASSIAAVVSGAGGIVTADNATIAAIAERDLRAALPLARDARVVRSLILREPRATFSLAPGQPTRPATRTRVPGLYLAGDWIDTSLPATIESAVVSGHRAAEAVLSGTSPK